MPLIICLSIIFLIDSLINAWLICKWEKTDIFTVHFFERFCVDWVPICILSSHFVKQSQPFEHFLCSSSRHSHHQVMSLLMYYGVPFFALSMSILLVELTQFPPQLMKHDRYHCAEPKYFSKHAKTCQVFPMTSDLSSQIGKIVQCTTLAVLSTY